MDCGRAMCSYEFTKNRDYFCTISLTPSHDEIADRTVPETYSEIYGGHYEGSDDLVTGVVGSQIDFQTFPTILCEKFKNLKKIYFFYSKIQKLTEKSFENCENLEIVNFVENDIKWIGQDTLKNLSKLERIAIQNSKLSYISDNLLKMNRNLKELRLSSNQFSLFNEKTLENHEKMLILDLSYNKIEGFPKHFFKSLRNLEILELQNNLITKIAAVWFETLINLKELDLSSNFIEDLPKNVFTKQRKLEKLNLNSNSIKFIHHDSFLILPYIIRLTKNKIIGVDEHFIKKLVETKKSVLLARNKCTEDSQVLSENIYISEREGGQDEAIYPIDDAILREIEPCFYSYIPRNENYQGDKLTKC